MATPTPVFSATAGDSSAIAPHRPEDIMTDLANALGMFDPTGTLADGVTAGGIGADNLKDDAVTTDAIADGAVTADKLDVDVATQAELDAHTALTTAHGAVSAATASKMVVRDSSGRAQFAAPSAEADAAIKATVTDLEIRVLYGVVW